jgi:hypothetical protein
MFYLWLNIHSVHIGNSLVWNKQSFSCVGNLAIITDIKWNKCTFSNRLLNFWHFLETLKLVWKWCLENVFTPWANMQVICLIAPFMNALLIAFVIIFESSKILGSRIMGICVDGIKMFPLFISCCIFLWYNSFS